MSCLFSECLRFKGENTKEPLRPHSCQANSGALTCHATLRVPVATIKDVGEGGGVVKDACGDCYSVTTRDELKWSLRS